MNGEIQKKNTFITSWKQAKRKEKPDSRALLTRSSFSMQSEKFTPRERNSALSSLTVILRTAAASSPPPVESMPVTVVVVMVSEDVAKVVEVEWLSSGSYAQTVCSDVDVVSVAVVHLSVPVTTAAKRRRRGRSSSFRETSIVGMMMLRMRSRRWTEVQL